MKITTTFTVGGVAYTVEVEDEDPTQAFQTAIFSAPRDTCDACGEIGFDSKELVSYKTKEKGFVYVKVKCSCGAESTLGKYLAGGVFWKPYEMNPRGDERDAEEAHQAPSPSPRRSPSQTGVVPPPRASSHAEGWDFKDNTAGQDPAPSVPAPPADPMTANQQVYLFSLVRELGLGDDIEGIVRERHGHGVASLEKNEASALIDALVELRDERAGPRLDSSARGSDGPTGVGTPRKQPSGAANGLPKITGWTEFWSWARPKGYTSAIVLGEALGIQSVLDHSPQELTDMILDHEARTALAGAPSGSATEPF